VLAPGLLLLVAAAVLLAAGAEMFVENVAAVARRLGLTVAATALLLAGAEPEEALTGVLASLADRPELAAGDAVGANVTLFTAVLGLTALVRPVPVSPRVRGYAVVAAAVGGAAAVLLAGGEVGRGQGVLLIAAYAVFVAVVWRRDRRPPPLGELAEATDEDGGERAGGGTDRAPVGRRAPGVVLAVTGLVLMGAGGVLAVDGATRVVAATGLRDGPVGLTLLALATTAELFALVLAAGRRGVPEVAVASLVGSAVYNATVSLGLAATVRPLRVEGMAPAAVLAAVLALVLIAAGRRGRLGRVAGAVLAASYPVYVVLCLRSGATPG